jgi:hypothetical protein
VYLTSNGSVSDDQYSLYQSVSKDCDFTLLPRMVEATRRSRLTDGENEKGVWWPY